MRQMALILLVGACAAPTPAPPATVPVQTLTSAVAPSVGGEAWPGTHWGMSKAEVHEALPQAVDWVQGVGNGGQVRGFGIQKYPIEGTCSVDVNFSFNQGRLALVMLTVKSDSSMAVDDDLRCYGIVERGLTGRYGLGATSQTGQERSVQTKSISWVTPSSQISLYRIQTPIYTERNGVVDYSYFTTVSYQPRHADVEGKF